MPGTLIAVMARTTPDEWLYDDWLLIARALRAYNTSGEVDGDDADATAELLGDIRHYWDLSMVEFGQAVMAPRRREEQ